MRSARLFVRRLDAKQFDRLAAAVGERLAAEKPLDLSQVMANADRNRDGVIDMPELTRFWKQKGSQLLLFSAAKKEPPTAEQLRRLAVIAATPCVVFGFLDNSIMLIAGDALDTALGVRFGLSALACAALGNIVADVTGQLSGGTIDAILRPYLPHPKLTPSQQASREARATSAVASTLGIFAGCVLGCFPLLLH